MGLSQRCQKSISSCVCVTARCIKGRKYLSPGWRCRRETVKAGGGVMQWGPKGSYTYGLSGFGGSSRGCRQELQCYRTFRMWTEG